MAFFKNLLFRHRALLSVTRPTFTASVVAAVEPTLQRAEINLLQRMREPKLNAYLLLLRAQALGYEFTEASLAAALRSLAGSGGQPLRRWRLQPIAMRTA